MSQQPLNKVFPLAMLQNIQHCTPLPLVPYKYILQTLKIHLEKINKIK